MPDLHHNRVLAQRKASTQREKKQLTKYRACSASPLCDFACFWVEGIRGADLLVKPMLVVAPLECIGEICYSTSGSKELLRSQPPYNSERNIS